MMDACDSRRFPTRIHQITSSSLITYFLFCVFGVGSWVAINGIFGELSVLVVSLPECYNLPAILAVVTQVANVGPVVYIIFKFLLYRCSVKAITVEIIAVYTLVIIGLMSCILLTFFWDRTAVVGNVHSVALILLTFCLALVDCTSTLVFIPFMKHFPAKYISALYIGEGMSGVLPSVAALSQGFVNDNLDCVGNYTGIRNLGINFSPNIYFMFLATLTILCGLAFTAIITLPAVRQQVIPASMSVGTHSRSRFYSPAHSSKITDNSEVSELKTSEEEVTESREIVGRFDWRENRPSQTQDEEDSSSLISGSTCTTAPQPNSSLSFYSGSSYFMQLLCIAWDNLMLLVCMFVLNFITNGALPSISAYIFKPYGNTVYHVALNLGILAGPFATLVYLLLSHKSRELIAVLTAIVCVLSTYLLVTALLSPDPLLKSHLAGKFIIVSGIICSILFVYTQLS